jgi:hypothetical protein
MPKYHNTTKKVHPFASAWMDVQKSLSQKKQQIMQSCNWTERTFNKKIKQAMDNKLILTNAQEEQISKILNIEPTTLLN